jgi:DinB family protein
MTRRLITICLTLTSMPASAHAQRAATQQTSVRPASATNATDSTTIKDRAAFLWFVRYERTTLTETADAMPADKYGFAPREGEFANVRTFSRQVKHLAATNYILAAAALGEQTPADAGDEQGPDSVITKAQHIAYLSGSYDALERAARAIGDTRIAVRSSPISPFQGGSATRIALISEALTHA